MNASDFNKLSNEITNVEKLDIVYNEILIPKIKLKAERKQKEFQIYKNAYDSKVGGRLKELGFSGDLQYLCRDEMLPYLIDKGFNVSYSCYFTTIKW